MCTDFYEAQATLSRRKQVTMFGHTNYSLEEETGEGWAGGCWRIKGTNLPAGKKTSSVCIVSGGIYSRRCSHKEMTSVWNLKAVILLKAPMVRLCVESCGLLFFLFLCSLLWVQAVPLQRDLALDPDF